MCYFVSADQKVNMLLHLYKMLSFLWFLTSLKSLTNMNLLEYAG